MFGGNLPALPVVVNDEPREVPWTDAANALNRLVWDNEFYTEEEQERLDDIDPVAIRESLEREGIVKAIVKHQNDEAEDDRRANPHNLHTRTTAQAEDIGVAIGITGSADTDPSENQQGQIDADGPPVK